ncbi:hypothetical protein [Ureibacillus aquaedulcis]|uniref:NERD domain-containing protein n=1 Tax=Ureibacillus aquaedulcis TaxID=3058421 RepID=A0ABT8GQ38_9BACL|nr:hypothetical protein [Ureibacillus sp. BA0131]MDN4493530.1 hypothetical protein [Ureibacillus sp. BA0131]
MGSVSQSEMLQFHDHFRDSLIIDKFDPQLETWHNRRMEKLQSETREDAMVWNVFRTLNQIERKLWVEQLFYKAFNKELKHSPEQIQIKLWKKIHPPKSLPLNEGKSDIDIIIESDTFVWFIEAKYRTDIALGTHSDPTRDEIIRYIDVGTNYARKRDFYFSLLLLDRFNSPIGYRLANEYGISEVKVRELLPHRVELPFPSGISAFQWKEVQALLKTIYLYSKNKHERFIADQVSYWLFEKIRDDQ